MAPTLDIPTGVGLVYEVRGLLGAVRLTSVNAATWRVHFVRVEDRDAAARYIRAWAQQRSFQQAYERETMDGTADD